MSPCGFHIFSSWGFLWVLLPLSKNMLRLIGVIRLSEGLSEADEAREVGGAGGAGEVSGWAGPAMGWFPFLGFSFACVHRLQDRVWTPVTLNWTGGYRKWLGIVLFKLLLFSYIYFVAFAPCGNNHRL